MPLLAQCVCFCKTKVSTWFLSLLGIIPVNPQLSRFKITSFCQLGLINPSMTNLTFDPINEDVFQSLFYPIGGIPVLIVTFLSLTFHLLNLPLSFIIIDYENNINRHATLLTKLQTAFYINTVMFNPITFTDIFRYSKTSFVFKKSGFFLRKSHNESFDFQVLNWDPIELSLLHCLHLF